MLVASKIQNASIQRAETRSNTLQSLVDTSELGALLVKDEDIWQSVIWIFICHHPISGHASCITRD